MKMVKKTGLVPVRAKTSAMPYKAGEVFGLPPDKARAALAAGDVELAEIDHGIETVPAPAAASKGPSVPKPKAESDGPKSEGPVEIPADWQALHHLKIVALAKKIQPGWDPKKEDGAPPPTDQAKEVIEAELERRKAPPES